MDASRKSKILVVEDDLSILMGLTINLTHEGYAVEQAQDGHTGLAKARSEAFDTIVLDIMLPGLNGYEVLDALRKADNATPVILLSARSLDVDKVLGFQVGADDYVVKPFSLPELLARIKTCVRRHRGTHSTVAIGRSVFHMQSHTLTQDGHALELTAQALKLLSFFVQHPNETFSRQRLLRAVWGPDYEGTPRTVDNFVGQLREKLEVTPAQPKHIQTVRGLGYRFTF